MGPVCGPRTASIPMGWHAATAAGRYEGGNAQQRTAQNGKATIRQAAAKGRNTHEKVLAM